MVYVTHDQNEAMTFADTVVVMNEGKLVQVGTPQDLYNRPQTTYVGYFIGSPAMNFLKCTLDDGKLQTAGGAIPSPARRLASGRSQKPSAGHSTTLRDVQGASPSEQAIRGNVVGVQEFGDYRVATVIVKDEVLRFAVGSRDRGPGRRHLGGFAGGSDLHLCRRCARGSQDSPC